MRHLIAATLILTTLAACASFTSPARVHELRDGKSYWFDYEGTRRGMILVNAHDSNGQLVQRSCAEPSPDAVVALSAEGKASAEYSGTGADAEAKGKQRIEALGERTQMVMFFREALFRVCEMSLNQSLAQDQVAGLYREIIRTALWLGSNKALDIEFLEKQRELEEVLAEKREVDDAKRQREAELAQASDRDKADAQQALARLSEESKAIDSRVIDNIGEINELSQKNVDSIVKAATDSVERVPAQQNANSTPEN